MANRARRLARSLSRRRRLAAGESSVSSEPASIAPSELELTGAALPSLAVWLRNPFASPAMPGLDAVEYNESVDSCRAPTIAGSTSLALLSSPCAGAVVASMAPCPPVGGGALSSPESMAAGSAGRRISRSAPIWSDIVAADSLARRLCHTAGFGQGSVSATRERPSWLVERNNAKCVARVLWAGLG